MKLLAHSRLVRMFSLGFIIQALSSGANFAVGLILIRRTNDLQYSYYVLVSNGLLLLAALQNAFIQPFTVTRLTRLAAPEQRTLIGNLMWTRRRWVPVLCICALSATAACRALHLLDTAGAVLIAASLLTAAATLGREFLRMVLFAHHRPREVLSGDAIYAAAMIVGVMAATFGRQPALLAIMTLGIAAVLGTMVLRQGLWRVEPWNLDARRDLILQLFAAGTWSMSGAGIHWLLIQGYSYLIAGTLNLRDVAAVAASRLTLMPVFVLSGGVSILLFPITSRWLRDIGVHETIRRLALITAALGAAALCYMATMWIGRDWIFGTILKKHIAHRDGLLLLWSVVFLVTLCRDQLATLLASRERFRSMTITTCISAGIWLVSSSLAIREFGAPGAVAGILVGELTNLVGIVLMIFMETRPRAAAT